MAGQLGSVLNPFMQQVVEIMDSRVDFENRVENYREIEMTVDANGVPVLNDKIKTGKTFIRGIQVIAAFNLTSSIVIFLLKVLKLSNRGSLTISSPLAFVEGLFFFLNYFTEKKGFSKYM